MKITIFNFTPKQIWYLLVKTLFSLYIKINLIFFTKLIFYLHKNRSGFFFNDSNQFSLFTKTDLNFFLKRGYMHNIDLCELVLVKCLSCMFNILLNIMHKRVYWSLESRRPDSVWAEWVSNTFSFRNLASELSSF